MKELKQMAELEITKAKNKETRRKGNQIGIIAGLIILTVLGFASGAF